MTKFKSILSRRKKTGGKGGSRDDRREAPAPGSPRTLDELHRLSRAVEELSFLNELAREIGASLNSREVMEKIIHRSLRAVKAEQAVITLLDQKSADPMRTYVRMMVTSIERKQYHFEQNLLGWMQINKKPLVVENPRNDERFKGVKWEQGIESLLCVPLMVKADLTGVLTVYNKRHREKFTEEDQRLLSIIAAQSAQVIENARLYEEEKALFRMQEEVKLAAKIQLDLLPKESPEVPGYEIAGKSIPAQMIGGDYFDYIRIDDSRLGVCLGDVSGKGLPASLLMANLQATLRGQTIVCTSPQECLQRSNKLLYHSTDPEKFATLFCGLLDTRKNVLSFSNAGHEPPFHVSSSKPTSRLKTGGLVLGIMEEFRFEEETVEMNPGDIIAIYSDGVIDAVNSIDEAFGEERLLQIVTGHRQVSAGTLVDKIVEAVQTHSADAPQLDDITIVVLKRLGE
jgi:sigma-B regulation protein RsbU (phosphoserine phosphatase)